MLPYKLEEDDRMPMFSFHIGNVEYGFFMFSVIWWIEILLIVISMSALAALTGAITYSFIIRRQGAYHSYLLGFGVLIPFWILAPFYGVELFDIRNKFMKFCFGAIVPTLGIFRTSEGKLPFQVVHCPYLVCKRAITKRSHDKILQLCSDAFHQP